MACKKIGNEKRNYEIRNRQERTTIYITASSSMETQMRGLGPVARKQIPI